MMARWAPLVLPLRRRLETLAVVVWASALFLVLLVVAVFVATPWLWPFTMAYMLFMFVDDAPTHGGRVLPLMRRLPIWNYFGSYFPVQLVKEAELDPTGRYLLAFHPHGIIGIGAWVNFGTECNQVSKLFPGIQLRVCTLESNFKVPLFRDYIMSLGFISGGIHLPCASVSKGSVKNHLLAGPGRAAVIVVGGAAEALDARPGTYDLTLKERKGFVKIALTTGASLVPVFSFGENDVFDQLMPNPEGTRLRTVQNRLKKLMGFSLPFFAGRGIFNYDYGFLPKRKRIVSVVGTPLPCPRTESPTPELIDQYHARYMACLEQLYDKYKDVYAKDRRHDMRFVH